MKKRILPILCGALAAVLLVLAAWLLRSARQGPAPGMENAVSPIPAPSACATVCPVPEGTPPVETMPPAEDERGLPRDKFFITVPRQRYQDGDLRLIIPKLEVDVAVLNGVDEDTLLKGVGLYDYAQLPGEEGANTSLAGHRNWVRDGKITLDQPFSHLDTLEEGDLLYLRDSEHIYRYEWEAQTVVESDDWSPIYRTDHAVLTLTTCTPVGISDHRLIVRARLAETLEDTGGYDYPSHIEEETAP